MEEAPQRPWFFSPNVYLPILDGIGLSEPTYRQTMGEVVALFPYEAACIEAQRLSRQHGGLTGFWIYPRPDYAITYHPVPVLVAEVRAKDGLYELLRFGRDLYDTQHLPGIAALRRDIQRFDQYWGRLFELQVLADCMRAGLCPHIMATPDCQIQVDGKPIYLEMRHRGLPFGAAVFHHIKLGLAFREFGEITVRLRAVGGRGEASYEVADHLRNDIILIIESNPTTPVIKETLWYEIQYHPEGEPRTLHFAFGTEATYEAGLEKLVRNTLWEKEKQLCPLASCGIPCVIALDLRNIAPPIPLETTRKGVVNYEFHRKRSQDIKTAILQGIRRFLSESDVVSGVLAYWHKDWWSKSDPDWVYAPDLLSLVTLETESLCDNPLHLDAILSQIIR